MIKRSFVSVLRSLNPAKRPGFQVSKSLWFQFWDSLAAQPATSTGLMSYWPIFFECLSGAKMSFWKNHNLWFAIDKNSSFCPQNREAIALESATFSGPKAPRKPRSTWKRSWISNVRTCSGYRFTPWWVTQQNLVKNSVDMSLTCHWHRQPDSWFSWWLVVLK